MKERVRDIIYIDKDLETYALFLENEPSFAIIRKREQWKNKLNFFYFFISVLTSVSLFNIFAIDYGIFIQLHNIYLKLKKYIQIYLFIRAHCILSLLK